MKHLLSFGHGYSAQEFTRQLPGGWSVIGTTRTSGKDIGIPSRQFPGDDLSAEIEKATHLLISAGPSEDGDPVLNAYRDQARINSNGSATSPPPASMAISTVAGSMKPHQPSQAPGAAHGD